MNDQLAATIRSNPHFIELQGKRKTFAWLLTVLMLIVYYGFILVIAYSPASLGQTLYGPITLGLFLGFGIIVFTIVITGIYILRANGEFERLTAQVLAEVGR
jgi:uncharacterized membrane protein (DUF485 family)